MFLGAGRDCKLNNEAPRRSASGPAHLELGRVGSTESERQTGPVADEHKMEKLHLDSGPERAEKAGIPDSQYSDAHSAFPDHMGGHMAGLV